MGRDGQLNDHLPGAGVDDWLQTQCSTEISVGRAA